MIPIKVITIVWDEDGDRFEINHEGVNGYEAIGMLQDALGLLASCQPVEESTEEP